MSQGLGQLANSEETWFFPQEADTENQEPAAFRVLMGRSRSCPQLGVLLTLASPPLPEVNLIKSGKRSNCDRMEMGDGESPRDLA